MERVNTTPTKWVMVLRISSVERFCIICFYCLLNYIRGCCITYCVVMQSYTSLYFSVCKGTVSLGYVQKENETIAPTMVKPKSGKGWEYVHIRLVDYR